MKKLVLILLVAIALGTGLSTAGFGQMHVEEAFKKAALPPDSNGTWVVRAVAKLYKADGTLLMDGSGNLDLKGNVLEGNLALKPPGGFFIKGQKMYLYIANAKPATIRVRHDLDGKPYLDRPAAVVTSETSYRAPFLRGKVVWDGELCDVSIFLTPEQAKAGKPEIRDAPPKTPIGARYQITGVMEVTNAEDGVAGFDNTCEIYGTIWIKLVDKDKKNYGNRKVFTLIPQDAMKGFKLNFDKNLFFDRYFDEPNWSFFHIEGSIFDSDGGMANTGDHDLLWGTRKGFRFASLSTDPVGKVITHTIPGDRSSENAEVYITITKVQDLFIKP